MSDGRENEQRFLTLVNITNVDREHTVKSLRWLADKIESADCDGTYHVVGDLDERITVMHSTTVVADKDRIDMDQMAKHAMIPPNAYEAIKREYQFKKTVQGFHDEIDEEFNAE